MPTPIGYYSASGIAALIGCSQFQTPFEAYQRVKERMEPGYNKKMGFIMPEFVDNAATRWGHAFEEPVIKLAEEKHDDKIISREKVFTSSQKGFEINCHIDGAFWKYNDGMMILHEGKTTNSRAYHSQKTEIDSYIDENGNFNPKKRIIRKWGEPRTDQVPEEYQIQTAVQRICTGAELVKLSVLVFPKTADEWEKEGWQVIENSDNKEQFNLQFDDSYIIDPYSWAKPWAQQGQFHTYNLPSNPPLEKAIITAFQEFHENHVLPGIPPECTDYPDVRRKLTNPIGTILADEELKRKCLLYSELVKQTGANNPAIKKKEALKIEINNLAMSLKKDDWSDPPDKLLIINPSGGEVLANISKSGFRAKRAK